MKNIAIIPARGGSKRIEKKNIKDFMGYPIIMYSIRSAIESNIFDEVMVSTDDHEIAEIATKFGAKVPFIRSLENSNDTAGTADVLIEVLEEYSLKSILFDNCCCLYPTAPFVTSENLIEAYHKFKTEEFNSIFPIVQYSYPIQRSLIIDNGETKMLWPENYHQRSQDLMPVYHDAGQYYWLKISTLFKEKKLWPRNTGSLIISELNAQDIDNESDWKLAEMKYKLSLL